MIISIGTPTIQFLRIHRNSIKIIFLQQDLEQGAAWKPHAFVLGLWWQKHEHNFSKNCILNSVDNSNVYAEFTVWINYISAAVHLCQNSEWFDSNLFKYYSSCGQSLLDSMLYKTSLASLHFHYSHEINLREIFGMDYRIENIITIWYSKELQVQNAGYSKVS